jgi:hypothetical protein
MGAGRSRVRDDSIQVRNLLTVKEFVPWQATEEYKVWRQLRPQKFWDKYLEAFESPFCCLEGAALPASFRFVMPRHGHLLVGFRLSAPATVRLVLANDTEILPPTFVESELRWGTVSLWGSMDIPPFVDELVVVGGIPMLAFTHEPIFVEVTGSALLRPLWVQCQTRVRAKLAAKPGRFLLGDTTFRYADGRITV